MNKLSNLEFSNKIIMFGFNYPNGFINKVWSGTIANHLQSKFNNCYDNVGSSGAFYRFYSQLDNENRTILIEWIINNHKG